MNQEPLRNPYPGGRPFDTTQSHLYFGRESHSSHVVELLAKRRFVAVVGEAGSGKTSLVRAGVRPMLEGGFLREAGSHWRVADIEPGDDPFGRLAEVLAKSTVLGSSANDHPDGRWVIEAVLRRGTRGLVDAFRQSRQIEPGENLLVIIDAFEQLLEGRKERAADDADAFVQMLIGAARSEDARIYVLLTLRAERLGECSRFGGLPEVFNDNGLYLLPRMTRDQRRAAIEGPLKVAGQAITPRLTQRLLNEVGDGVDALQKLQGALRGAWDNWSRKHAAGEAVDLHHHEAIGAVSDALSRVVPPVVTSAGMRRWPWLLAGAVAAVAVTLPIAWLLRPALCDCAPVGLDAPPATGGAVGSGGSGRAAPLVPASTPAGDGVRLPASEPADAAGQPRLPPESDASAASKPASGVPAPPLRVETAVSGPASGTATPPRPAAGVASEPGPRIVPPPARPASAASGPGSTTRPPPARPATAASEPTARTLPLRAGAGTAASTPGTTTPTSPVRSASATSGPASTRPLPPARPAGTASEPASEATRIPTPDQCQAGKPDSIPQCKAITEPLIAKLKKREKEACWEVPTPDPPPPPTPPSYLVQACKCLTDPLEKQIADLEEMTCWRVSPRPKAR